jgi:uncharacterized protein (TIGR00369 family)
MTSTKINFNNPPKFLLMLGCTGVDFDEVNNSSTMKFDISADYTHSNGTIVQGGFITAMLDAAMAHLVILKRNQEVNPLSLNVNVNFIAPGAPGTFIASANITKMGKNIAFTSAELHQNDVLIATSTSTNRLILLSK